MTGYLLDTQTLLWLALDRQRIAIGARDILFAAPLFVSVVSAAEIAIKSALGKLGLPPPFETDFDAAFRGLADRAGIDVLDLDLQTVARLRRLPHYHRDPFDRLIIAQALQSGLTVATSDRVFRAYAGLEILDI